jgi:TRAP-type C4-dicarboxylate transport system permease large subunit
LGILVAANVGIGMISPPVGICLFVSCGRAERRSSRSCGR